MTTPMIISEAPRAHGCLVTALWFIRLPAVTTLRRA